MLKLVKVVNTSGMVGCLTLGDLCGCKVEGCSPGLHFVRRCLAVYCSLDTIAVRQQSGSDSGFDETHSWCIFCFCKIVAYVLATSNATRSWTTRAWVYRRCDHHATAERASHLHYHRPALGVVGRRQHQSIHTETSCI